MMNPKCILILVIFAFSFKQSYSNTLKDLWPVLAIIEKMGLTPKQEELFVLTRLQCARSTNIDPQIVKDFDFLKNTGNKVIMNIFVTCLAQVIRLNNEKGNLDLIRIKDILGEKNLKIIKGCENKNDKNLLPSYLCWLRAIHKKA